MALIVEDGTGVTNANSYVSLVTARAYAVSRGISLSDSDALLEQYLLKAVDYLDSLRAEYRGVKTSATYALQWPRYGATLDGVELASNVIPTELKNAQVRLAAHIQSGVDPTPVGSGDAFVVSEKIGPIETKYSEGVATSGVPILRDVDLLLAPLLRRYGALSTERA